MLQLNNLTPNDTIRIDQVILIPDGVPDPEITKGKRRLMHEVQTGDTLYSISRTYQVEVEHLMEWNGKVDRLL